MTRPYPDKKNTLSLLADWQAHAEAIDKMMDGITTSIGLDSNGPMCNTVWTLFNAYTQTLAMEVGDFGGWLEWHQAENEMGAKGVVTGYDGNHAVQTLDDLYRLIEESRKRAAP